MLKRERGTDTSHSFTFDLSVVVHRTDLLLTEFHMGSHCCTNWVEFWIKEVNILLAAALFLFISVAESYLFVRMQAIPIFFTAKSF